MGKVHTSNGIVGAVHDCCVSTRGDVVLAAGPYSIRWPHEGNRSHYGTLNTLSMYLISCLSKLRGRQSGHGYDEVDDRRTHG